MILSRGKEMSGEGMVKLHMADGECHWNTAKLFQQGKVDKIVVGYALNAQGWHQHTWGEKDGKVVETTPSNFINKKYFGAPLDDKEGAAFAKFAEKNRPGMGMVRTHQGGSIAKRQ